MYPTGRSYEGHSTWFGYVSTVFGEKDLNTGIDLLAVLLGPISPVQAREVFRQLMDLYGPLAPEVVEASAFFLERSLRGGEEAQALVMAPNAAAIAILRFFLLDAERALRRAGQSVKPVGRQS